MSSILMFSKHLLKSNPISGSINGLNFSKNLIAIKRINPIGVRFLFSDEVLGISNYLTTRDRISAQFGQMKDKFFGRMEEYTKSDSKMIFTEDLKNVVFLTSKDDIELSLMSEAIKKFHSQNQSLQFGTFVFGPIVMRLLCHLSEWELALTLFKDPQLKGFFSQVKSTVMLMNLLFVNGKYEQCMDVLVHVQNEAFFETKFPRDCLLLYIASAYKLNTSESFDRALEMLKKARDAGVPVTRKTVCLFAALALNQNNANVALEVLSLVTQTNYVTVRNLRLMALSDLERFDDLFIALRLIINRDVPSETRRPEILEETVERIRAKVESKADKTLSSEFSQIEKALIDGNQISNSPLEQILLSPVVMREDAQNRSQGYLQQRGFRNPMVQQNLRRPQRKTLYE